MQFGNDWIAVPAARNLSVRFAALRNAYLRVGRRPPRAKPGVENAASLIEAADRLFTRLDSGTYTSHGEKRPLNGDVALLE